MKNKISFDLKELPKTLKRFSKEAQRYLVLISFVLLIGLYGFLVLQISRASQKEPNQDDITAQSGSIKRLKIDQGSIDKIQKLEDQNKELEKTGWKEVKNRPDVLLTYDVLVERGIKSSSNPVYSRSYSRLVYNPYTRRYTTIYYPSQFEGYERDERPIKEGTVTISMIDTKTDKTVWQGWTTDEVNSRNLTTKEIQNSVRSIFKKFDVAKN